MKKEFSSIMIPDKTFSGRGNLWINNNVVSEWPGNHVLELRRVNYIFAKPIWGQNPTLRPLFLTILGLELKAGALLLEPCPQSFSCVSYFSDRV
jgi:hypothetical protein